MLGIPLRRLIATVFAALAALVLSTGSAAAAPGDPDPTFGGDGVVVDDLFSTTERPAAIAPRPSPESGYVVAGSTSDATDPTTNRTAGDALVARYGPDGTLDPAFGTGGKLRIDFGPDQADDDHAPALAVQPDGKMLVGGWFTQGPSDDAQQIPALVRLNRNGTLDPTFDGDGRAAPAFPEGRIAGLGLLPDGRIVAFGEVHRDATGHHLAVARYLGNGAPDTSFSGDGWTYLDSAVAGPSAFAAGGVAQADGRLVVVGGDVKASVSRFLTARFKADGSPDTSWSVDGVNVTEFVGSPAGSVAGGVTLQPDGKVVLAGESGGVWHVARYTPTGTHDAGFSGDGKATLATGFASTPLSGARVTVTPSGRVVLTSSARAGAADPETGIRDSEVVVGQLKADGYADPDFGGGDGVRTYGLAPGAEDSAGAVLATGGRLLVAGASDDPSAEGHEPDAAVMRLVGASEDTPPGPAAGQLDGSFSGDGLNRTPGPFWSVVSVARMPASGRVVVGGKGYSMTDAAGYGSGYDNHHFSRFLPNGALDAENFSRDECIGDCMDHSGGLWKNPGDLIIPGIQNVGANDVAVQPGAITDGRIVAAGSRGGTCGAAIIRITESGFADTSFGPTGDGFSATYEGCEAATVYNALAVRPDGRIIAVGATGRGWGGYETPFVAQYNADGSLDVGAGSNDSTPGDGFGNGGIVMPIPSDIQSAYDVVRQPDGKLVLVSESFIVRLTEAGALDETFGTGGRTAYPDRRGPARLVRQPDGKLLVGQTEPSAGFRVTRFNSDGTLDTNFGSDGVATLAAGTGCTDALLGALHLQSDGKIVVGGTRALTCADGGGSMLARFHPDGTLDTTFGQAGRVLGTFPATTGYTASITDMVGQPDGKLIAVGSQRTIARFHLGAMAPRNSARPTITGTPKEGQTLSSTTGTWSTTEIEFRRQWLRCTEQGAECEPIFTPAADGRVMPETGITYTARREDVGRALRVRITAHKNGAMSSAVSSPALVHGTPLSSTARPAVTGHPSLSQQLSAKTSFTGTEPTIEYQWLRCGDATVASCYEIPATARTYEPIPADQGNRLRVRVKASNYENSVTELSGQTGVVGTAERYAARPRWSAAPEFRRNPMSNPSADAFGGAGVWRYLSGPNVASPSPTDFKLLTNTCCGYWGNEEPYFQIGPTPGEQRMLLSPSASSDVVAWRAPQSGTYRIAGTVGDDASETNGDGVEYAVLEGSTRLAVGDLEPGGAERPLAGATGGASLASVALTAGQLVYLAVRPKADNGWDGMRAGLAIEQLNPSVAISTPAASSQVNRRPTLSGRASSVAGDAGTVIVRLYAGTAATGTPVQTLNATRSGTSWSVTPATALAVGTYTAVAEQAAAAPAPAGRSASRTFKVIEPPNVTVTSGKLRYTAPEGTANTVIITRGASAYSVIDTTAPVRPGAGCSPINANRVDCPLTGVTAIDAAGGDLDDKLTIEAPTPATLSGGDGNDDLTGGAGNDRLDGGAGGDLLSGRDGTDLVSYATRTTGVVVDIDGVRDDGATLDGSTASVRDNVALDIENVLGGSGADTLSGSGSPNTLDGGGGGDILSGRGGVDTVTYATRSAPVTADLDGVRDDGNVEDNATATSRDLIRTDVENLVGGTAGDTLSATAANAVVNTLTGGSGDDTLKTRDGTATVDRLLCGAGTDGFDSDPGDARSLCETAVAIP